MIVFHTDLDNTIIYSYRHDIGPDKLNVELYQGKEISYITRKTFSLLTRLRERALIVPTTTRTAGQYNRIHLGIGNIKYALVCNGGILLEDGIADKTWYQESLSLTQEDAGEMRKGIRLLERDPRREFEVRFPEELFVFTKCRDPESVVGELCGQLDQAKVDVFHNGEKVYIVPVPLNKGNALLRFKARIGADYVIAAGDSEFDLPMIQAADVGYVPRNFTERFGHAAPAREMPVDGIFSEWLLEESIKNLPKGLESSPLK